MLPVVVFDALLPNQRLTGSTEDPTFCRLLRDLGLGGLFVMVSWNPYKKRVRRHGVVCRIEFIDALKRPGDSDGGDPEDLAATPTAVDFIVAGRQPCTVRGPATGMVARVGRWRYEHDPNCEDKVLGWGPERFHDLPPVPGMADGGGGGAAGAAGGEEEGLACTRWTSREIECTPPDAADAADSEGESAEAVALAESLLPLLDRWLELASSKETYECIDVTATTRVRHGEPGLSCDPKIRLERVRGDLGRRPPPSRPTALALWGAALINPLPPLGVALEIRGRVLEAPTAVGKLTVLKQGVERSIENLEGNRPL